MIDGENIGRPYPEGLLDWAGHRGGGVRKPFRTGSGRPTGTRIETPLVSRLRKWSDTIVADASAPRTVLLVGGPGNGKTDAIESCIEFLDSSLGTNGQIYEALAAQFVVASGQLPPRKASIDLSAHGTSIPGHLKGHLDLVQDATESDPRTGGAAEELLLQELAVRLETPQTGLYLCCVNRGILAHAATVAQERDSRSSGDRLLALLSRITAAVTSGPASPQCWPLAGFPQFAVWPMDVESLVDPSLANDGLSVAHQIFLSALSADKWSETCRSGRRCPFCRNRELLSDRPSLDALIRLLRYYELASGKRWTFRDLFSLVPFILVGDYSELQVKNKPATPCAWAAYENELAASSRSEDPARGRAIYQLTSRLYYHRLFSRWPTLDRGDHRRAKALLPAVAFSKGLERAREFFKYLAHSSDLESSGDIQSILRGPFSDALDPALSPTQAEIPLRGQKQISVSRLEELFSLSVREGLEAVKTSIDPLERDLLAQLTEADESLVEDLFPRNRAHHVKLLQSSLRQYCARLVKRSLGARTALCRDLDAFSDYSKAIQNPKDLLDVRKQMRKLLHDDKNRFRASLVTTFGQPVAQRSRDIVLLTQAVQVKEVRRQLIGERPVEALPYVMVDQHLIPITFPLFKALRDVVAGLHDASLSAEIFALLNGVKSMVSGRVVRDVSKLEEDSTIELGNTGLAVDIVGDQFRLSNSAIL
jgi:hypothetical protein